MDRIQWVDRARGISILLVVLLHSRIELGFLGVWSPGLEWVLGLTSTMRMPLFFAAAGLFAVKWVTQRSWRELVSGKIAILLWVFLIWQPVVFAYKVAEMIWLPDQPDNTLITQVGKLVLSPLRPNGELWFLWALCLFFIIAKLTSRLPVWVQVGVPAVISAAWMSFTPVMPEEFLRTIGAGWEGVIKYYVFFAAAVVLSTQLIRLFSTVPRWGALAMFGAWVAVGLLLGIDVIEDTVPGLRFILCALGVLAGFSLARLLSPITLLDRVGRNTLPIYVAHIPVIVAIVVPAHLLGMTPLIDTVPELSVVLLAAAAVTGAWWIHRGLTKTRYGRFMYEQPAWFLAGTRALKRQESAPPPA